MRSETYNLPEDGAVVTRRNTGRRRRKPEWQPHKAPRLRREEVNFPPNTPVTLALKFAQGKLVAGINSERMMFTTTDNRVCGGRVKPDEIRALTISAYIQRLQLSSVA